ncbi:MAG: hypothetical protein R2733_20650 [Acidimicrobiales bacterium]
MTTEGDGTIARLMAEVVAATDRDPDSAEDVRRAEPSSREVFEFIVGRVVPGYINREALRAERGELPWQQAAYPLTAVEEDQKYRELLEGIATTLINNIANAVEHLVNPFTGEHLDIRTDEAPPTSPREFRRWMVEQELAMQESIKRAARVAVELSESAESLAQLWVVAGRTSGMTWRQVADLTGVSPQAAQQRYKDL